MYPLRDYQGRKKAAPFGAAIGSLPGVRALLEELKDLLRF